MHVLVYLGGLHFDFEGIPWFQRKEEVLFDSLSAASRGSSSRGRIKQFSMDRGEGLSCR